MSDYSEHLISMAGGDGDPLDAIRARIAADRDEYATDQADQNIRDRETLLDSIQDQQNKLDRIIELAHWAGKRGWTIHPAEIRTALAVGEGS